jgi:hypothetical protein
MPNYPEEDETSSGFKKRFGGSDHKVSVKRTWEDENKFEASSYKGHPQGNPQAGAGYAGPTYEEGDKPISSANKARQTAYNRASTDYVTKAKSGQAAKEGQAKIKNTGSKKTVKINTDPAKGK